MSVASLELCKELYELSGWEPKDNCTSSSYSHHGYYENGVYVCPKYDLGYLLRKLPHSIILSNATDSWVAFYGGEALTKADTPEDAACKLAIELFKQGVMEPEL